jgi:hypothetical protein
VPAPQITLAEGFSDGRGGFHVKIDPKTQRAVPRGKFSFIDLAGSERGADTVRVDGGPALIAVTARPQPRR